MNLTELDRLYEEMIAWKQAIAQSQTELKRRAQLNWVAPHLDLPRAECRTMFQIWLLSQVSGGES
jgi:hypothetical protein